MKEEIEAMAKDLGIAFQLAGTTRFGAVAEILVNTGWRKQSEGVTDTNVGSKSEWISVEDRLPTQRFVIACDEYGNVGEVVRIGESRFEWIGNDDRAFVTHWMPLPEPPKGE
jgi:hypothetical protein